MPQTLDISNYEFSQMKKSKFEISKVYTIRWKKYRYQQIRVCYKDSNPFFKNVSSTLRKIFMNGFNDKPKGMGNPNQNHFIPVQNWDLLDSTNQFISSRGLNQVFFILKLPENKICDLPSVKIRHFDRLNESCKNVVNSHNSLLLLINKK